MSGFNRLRAGGFAARPLLLRPTNTLLVQRPTNALLHQPARTFLTPLPRRGPIAYAKPFRGSSSGRVSRRLHEMEQTLHQIHEGVERNHRVQRAASDLIERLWRPEMTEALKKGIDLVVPYLESLMQAPRMAAGVLLTLFTVGYAGRHAFYRGLANESAEIGALVLEKNVQNLTHTLEAVATNQETLDALLELLKQLLEAEPTRKALIELLIKAFEDEALKHQTGVFALDALDTPDARRMLDTQVSRLVSAAVLDDDVQRDTAVGVKGALKRVVIG